MCVRQICDKFVGMFRNEFLLSKMKCRYNIQKGVAFCINWLELTASVCIAHGKKHFFSLLVVAVNPKNSSGKPREKRVARFCLLY